MIDAHVHVVNPNLPGCEPLGDVLLQGHAKVAQAIREQMKQGKISRVLAMGEWRISPHDPLGVNDTLKLAESVPGLSAIGICDPTRDAEDGEHFKRVDKALSHPRIVALKIYLGYLHFSTEHPTYRRYYELAARHKIPVIFHTGDTYSATAKLKYSHPLTVDDIAVDHRDTQFVLAHLGNPWTIDAAQVIYKNPNVWADLSGLVVADGHEFEAEEYRDGLSDLAERIRKAFRYADRPGRFVFGSDWPLVPIRPYREFVATMIPRESHEQVFRENAESLFSLKS